MTSFTFTYNGKKHSGNYCPSTRGNGWVKVIFFGHSATILPVTLHINDAKRTWIQNILQGESVWPHELIQTMGESIESILKSDLIYKT